MDETRLDITYRLNSFPFSKLNLLYLNINALKNKIDEIELIIGLHSDKIIHFIALTEIRIIQESNKYFHLPQYRAYFNNRDSGDGGVALFIHESIQTRELINECYNNINFILVNLIDKKFNIGVIYKQPKVKKTLFIEYTNNQILAHKNSIIVGDTNINLLDNTASNDYVQTIHSNGFEILNKIDGKYATRIEKKENRNECRTIIDHIITDKHTFKYTFSINKTKISDHNELVLNIDNKTSNEKNFHKKRVEIDKTIIDNNKYSSLIDRMDLSNISNFEQLNDTLNNMKQLSTKKIQYTKELNPYKQ